MFGRMMNNYYYGKSGKGDFRKEDLPQNRKQLFSDTLKTRLSALFRINLLYMLIFLPAMLVIMYFFTNGLSSMYSIQSIQDSESYTAYTEQVEERGAATGLTEEQYNQIRNTEVSYAEYLKSMLFQVLLWLVPCIAITGPFTAGLSYVTRNWARDEHAFLWTDFRDAMKENWKQSLLLSAITAVLPFVVYVGWEYYGQLAANNAIMFVPQMLVLLASLIWAISITYMHPMAVTYRLKMKDLIRNGLLLGVARLPMSVGIRLLHCVPAAIAAAVILFWNPWYGAMFLFAYYFLIGFALSRFITASYTNAVFDRFINPRIEGAKVDQGLHKPDDDDDDEEGEDIPEGKTDD